MKTETEAKKKRGEEFVQIHATIVETFRQRVYITVPAEEAEDIASATERIEQVCNDDEVDITETCDDLTREVEDVVVVKVAPPRSKADDMDTKGGK